MTATTAKRTPEHLRRYIVEQNYARYSSEDQAVWRYIFRQLKSHLSRHAHASYIDGLAKTGLSEEHIPHIEHIDQCLESFGWGAVPVSGFIPPAAFMEFQSIGILPIASDMRTLDHLLYTPAPDIVHEAAGHAPILINRDYAHYLRQYGTIARKAIINKSDLAQYEAIRILSDLKEDPTSTPADIRSAEQSLGQLNAQLSAPSEAALLSRMNWWTAEYGLIGEVDQPKIFGAGLLSSVGESRDCLSAQVKKIPLSVACVDYSYDITEPQPQLFVARDFAQLSEVLEQLSQRLAFRRGGEYGLRTAVQAETVNTVELSSGLQISGTLIQFTLDQHGHPSFLRFSGPCQLAVHDRELMGQGVARHPQGFSSPIGRLKGHSTCLSTCVSEGALAKVGLRRDARTRLEFASGMVVAGLVRDWCIRDGRLLFVTWSEATVTHGAEKLYDPSWGDFDMAIGERVTSVYAGPADRVGYGATDEFVAKRVGTKTYSTDQLQRQRAFAQIQECRVRGRSDSSRETFHRLLAEFLASPHPDWLFGLELLELAQSLQVDAGISAPLLKLMQPERFTETTVQRCVRDGLKLMGWSA